MPRQDFSDSWNEIVNCITRSLGESDDASFWDAAISEIFRDAEYLCDHTRSKGPLFTEIGACSHWQRPHQHRWLKDGSFAMPTGYGGNGSSIYAKPEFDWSLRFGWNAHEHCWAAVEKIRGRCPLTFRVTLPTRTEAHDQAAVHTVWTPGPPTEPTQKSIRLYGFRKKDNQWQCTATGGNDAPYNIAEGNVGRT